VKKLRKEIQDRNRELHELRVKQPAQPAPIDEPLTIPTLESADWDEEVYQHKLAAYYERKSAQEKAKQPPPSIKDAQADIRRIREDAKKKRANQPRQPRSA